MIHPSFKLRKPSDIVRRAPHELFLKKVILINFYLAGRFFKIKSWLGKYKEHLIKNNWIIIHKIWYTIMLIYSCGKLCLYNNQTMRFPHKQFLNVICIYDYWKRCSFSSNKLARGWKKLSWLVKKEHFFPKIKFSKRFISLKYTLYRSLSMRISTFSKICREVLFMLYWQYIFFDVSMNKLKLLWYACSGEAQVSGASTTFSS